MKRVKVLSIFIAALVVNYSSGWTYEKETETSIPVNDTVTVPASYRYGKLNPLKWFFLGNNYRREWSVPVAMPVFHLLTTKGGFYVEKIGGGQQTRKLHLISRADSSEWELRSVDKYVREALPPKVRGTFIQSIVQDQISAAYPYALLTIYDMANAESIPSTTAELFYVPDDPAFGKYRPVLAHSVCFLSPKNINGVHLHTEDNDSILVLLGKNNHYEVMQEKVLTARLFDMLIADWDRHGKQWEWAFIDSGSTVYIYPVPEDRDQAFFLTQGMLAKISRPFGLKHMVGFKRTPDKLKALNTKAHEFDRFFLNDLDRNDWARGITQFQENMTDAVIERAVSKLPPEVYELTGKEIEEKLKSRRDGLLTNGLDYYNFLASEVTVYSSRMPEHFQIIGRNNELEVNVYRADDHQQIYHRVFVPADTKKLTIALVDEHDRVDTSGLNTQPVSVHIEFRKAAANP